MFGRPPGGTFADGVSRVAYSDADVAGRRYVIDLMRAAGLDPRVDPAGNIFGRRAGTDQALPPILFGSHIDSVPNGGNFDGDLGSLAALGVLEALAAAGLRTRHPLEMVVWAAEEGVAFGQVAGRQPYRRGRREASDMDQVWNGMTRADAIRKIGGDPDRIMEAIRPKGAHHCYLELHIEQGGTLDRERIPVGVVEGIVAIDRYEVTVTGFANHAGTTPMADRQDALLAASHLTIAVRDVVTSEPGRQVGTVGRLEVTPNVAECDSGRRPAHDRTSRSVDRKAQASGRTDPAARDRDREADQDIDRAHARQFNDAGERRRGGAAGDRTGRGAARPRQPPAAEWCRP